MPLKHEFIIIDKNSNQDVIEENMNAVSISDMLILYLSDSFQWINTCWNGRKEEKELNYYGYTIISNENIERLNQILENWIKLFEIAPEEFYLTGNYILEKACYEKNCINKKEFLIQLNALKNISENAIQQKKNILHNGI